MRSNQINDPHLLVPSWQFLQAHSSSICLIPSQIIVRAHRVVQVLVRAQHSAAGGCIHRCSIVCTVPFDLLCVLHLIFSPCGECAPCFRQTSRSLSLEAVYSSRKLCTKREHFVREPRYHRDSIQAHIFRLTLSQFASLAVSWHSHGTNCPGRSLDRSLDRIPRIAA